MVLELNQLIWDDFNSEHIGKHKVSKDEIVEVCTNYELVLQVYNNRLLLMGQTESGRWLSVVLDEINQGSYYVVTARDSSRKERRLINEDNK